MFVAINFDSVNYYLLPANTMQIDPNTKRRIDNALDCIYKINFLALISQDANGYLTFVWPSFEDIV